MDCLRCRVGCCRYSDDCLYRARVEDATDIDDVTVLFVDYGNTEQVSRACVFALPAGLVAGCYALPCRLAGVGEGVGGGGELVEEKRLLAEVMAVRGGGGEGEGAGQRYEVMLRDMGVSVAEKLRTHVVGADDDVDEAEAAAAAAVREEDREEGVATLLNFSDDEEGEEEEEEVSVGGAGLAPGRSRVCVCGVESPGRFWVQATRSAAALACLHAAMDAHYGGAEDGVQTADVQPGRLYAVHTGDGHWRRARCGHSDALTCVDTGATVTGAARTLRRRFADALPAQAVACYLGGVAPRGGGDGWDAAATELFGQLTANRSLVAEVQTGGRDGAGDASDKPDVAANDTVSDTSTAEVVSESLDVKPSAVVTSEATADSASEAEGEFSDALGVEPPSIIVTSDVAGDTSDGDASEKLDVKSSATGTTSDADGDTSEKLAVDSSSADTAGDATSDTDGDASEKLDVDSSAADTAGDATSDTDGDASEKLDVESSAADTAGDTTSDADGDASEKLDIDSSAADTAGDTTSDADGDASEKLDVESSAADTTADITGDTTSEDVSDKLDVESSDVGDADGDASDRPCDGDVGAASPGSVSAVASVEERDAVCVCLLDMGMCVASRLVEAGHATAVDCSGIQLDRYWDGRRALHTARQAKSITPFWHFVLPFQLDIVE